MQKMLNNGLKAVYNSSKVKSLKAIHNDILVRIDPAGAVYNSSKVKSLKAIHNICLANLFI